MPIEVDQSNKVERTDKDTILAFSDGEHFAIVIPGKVKREALEHLIGAGKARKVAYLMLFSAGLFLLLWAYLAQANHRGEQVVIDTEYSGQEAKIRSMLLRLAQEASLSLAAERVVFSQIGKESNAHRLAWGVQREKIAPDRRITTSELLALWA